MKWLKEFFADIVNSQRLAYASRSAHYNLQDAGRHPVFSPISVRSTSNPRVRYSWSYDQKDRRTQLCVEAQEDGSNEWVKVTDIWGYWWPLVVADTEALRQEHWKQESERRARAEKMAK